MEPKERNVGSDSIRKRRLPEVPMTQRPAKNSKYEETRVEHACVVDGEKFPIVQPKCLAVEDDRGVSSSCETHCSRANQLVSPMCPTSKDVLSSSQSHRDEESLCITQALEVTTSNIELDDDGGENNGEGEESANNLDFEETENRNDKSLDLLADRKPSTQHAVLPSIVSSSRRVYGAGGYPDGASAAARAVWGADAFAWVVDRLGRTVSGRNGVQRHF